MFYYYGQVQSNTDGKEVQIDRRGERNEYYFKQGYHIAIRSAMLWMIRKGTTNVELSEYEAALNEDYEKYHDKWLKEIQQ